MTNEEKQLIKTELIKQIDKYSANIMATKLSVSTATISQVKNDNWKLINAKMWRKIKVGLKVNWNWNIVETTNMKILNSVLMAAQTKSMAIGIAENAGFGKSEIYKAYAKKYRDVIYVECESDWNKKEFLDNLLLECGVESLGTSSEKRKLFISNLMDRDRPLVILDQVSELQIKMFKGFFNPLFNHAGWIMSGTKSFEKKMRRGVQRDRDEYKEVWSRIGSKMYSGLTEATLEDVSAICSANGITDEDTHHYIYNSYDGDIRTVRRAVEATLLKRNKTN